MLEHNTVQRGFCRAAKARNLQGKLPKSKDDHSMFVLWNIPNSESEGFHTRS